MDDMRGKVALVTGGSSGIGLCAARALARRGAAVVIAARDEERGREALRALHEAGATAEFVAADVSRADDVERLVKTTVERFGRLDCAFNNAASSETGIGKTTADYLDDEWARALELNLTSVWLCMKHEIGQMLAQGGGGAIVNTSSVNGLGGVRGAAPYAVAKAGVIALAKSAAMEYAAQGIRVNVLVAGAFDTPMLRGVIERAGGGTPEGTAAVEQVYRGLVPLGRIGSPDEAGEAAAWLCSDAASYVTGHTLIVDGGMTAWAR